MTQAATLLSPADVPHARPNAARTSGARWTGRVLSGLAVTFLAWDATMKIIAHPMAVEGSAELGYSEHTVVTIGVIALLCLVVYLVPRTALLGAVLWTGYLGGAIATHLRVGSTLLSHTLFPLIVAALLWGGLWLRDRRVHALVFGTR